MMPTKILPSHPSLAHLKQQAKELQRLSRLQDAAAIQRLREFHPRFSDLGVFDQNSKPIRLADAQLCLAREYGFASWTRLKTVAEIEERRSLDLPLVEQIADPEFRCAVELFDLGDRDGLARLLSEHPRLLTKRVTFEARNYFRNPTLLAFTAENPVRTGRLPSNAIELVKLILNFGAVERSSVTETLELVASGKVAREMGLHLEYIELLCGYGADTGPALRAALGQGEFGAVDALLKAGAKLDLLTAAALGDHSACVRLFEFATDQERHLAVAWAVQYGHMECVRFLVMSGVDPTQYNPVGAHAHSTPLHQAAYAGHDEVVRFLVEQGCRLDIRDIHYGGTPLEWARHGGRLEIVQYLENLADRKS